MSGVANWAAPGAIQGRCSLAQSAKITDCLREHEDMWYAITGTDHPDSLDRRLAARGAHLARLEKLLQEGRLLLAGPFPAIDSDQPGPAGFTGSLIVAEFSSLAEAEQWAKADPYIEANVYANVSVKPFRKVLPA
jgi:uncharacterized protein